MGVTLAIASSPLRPPPRTLPRTSRPVRAGSLPYGHRLGTEAFRRRLAAMFCDQGQVRQPVRFWQREQPARLAGCAVHFAPGTGRGFAWFRSAHSWPFETQEIDQHALVVLDKLPTLAVQPKADLSFPLAVTLLGNGQHGVGLHRERCFLV